MKNAPALKTLVSLLWGSHFQKENELISFGRNLSLSLGVKPNPVGGGNLKTKTPATYRPVGVTCPAACPNIDFCYAKYGNVALHQRRASPDTDSSVFSVAIAIVAALKTGTLARLHVSGGFYKANYVDHSYIEALLDLTSIIREVTALPGPFAWTYTQTSPEEFYAKNSSLTSLEDAGIIVLLSGAKIAGGAVIYPHAKIHELFSGSASTVRFLACPAQIKNNKTSCRECMLCPKARSLGLCIVFEPEGRNKKALGVKVTKDNT